MKLKMKYLLVLFSILAFIISFDGCSDLNKNIPAAPEVSTHGAGTFDSTSTNYHPNLLAKFPDGLYSCQSCHAADFSGGITGVSCNSANCHPSIGVHLKGVIDTTSNNFHGYYIKDHQWDMRPCKSCHGENYAGGMVSPSCLNCHTYLNGPENCTTCHGSKTSNAPPKDLEGNYSTSARGVGAHQSHLKGGSLGKFLTCTECHNVPGSVYIQGHIDGDNRAEVLMNDTRANLVTNDPSTSNYDPSQPTYIPTPEYNLSDLTCSNTYCHGYFKNGNLANKPVWNNPSTAACGTCHGSSANPLPGGSHPSIGSLTCSVCHGGVVNANNQIINPSKHIDGLLNLLGNDIKF